MLFSKRSEKYRLIGDIDAVKWEDVISTINPFVPKDTLKELETRIIKGFFKEVTILSEASTLAQLFELPNLKLKGKVEEGELLIPEVASEFSQIKGDLALDKGALIFSGESVVNGTIYSNIKELTLKFFEREPQIFLSGLFKGKGEDFKKMALSLSNKSNFLKEWDISGEMDLTLKLEGNLIEPLITLSIHPKPLKIKFPFLEKKLSLDEGEINFNANEIECKNLALTYGDSFLAGIKREICIVSKFLRSSHPFWFSKGRRIFRGAEEVS